MDDRLSEDQIEIIQDFIQESRDMIDQLEPAIIELGHSCQKVDCWTVLGCPDAACPTRNPANAIPCWLNAGYLGNGRQTCGYAGSPQDCLDCKVFQLTNGSRETMNAIFRLFHSMKGSAGFLDLTQISQVAHAAENLLDLIRNGKIEMIPDHVDLLCRSCDFAKEALDCVTEHYNDQAMAEDAVAIAGLLHEAIDRSKASAAQEPPPAAAPQPGNGSGLSELGRELLDRFILEADDLLQSMEDQLLRWRETDQKDGSLNELFRLTHSLKGSCGLIGVSDMERLCEEIESILEAIRSGAKSEEPDIIELLLDIVGQLRGATAALAEGGDGTIPELPEVLERSKATLHTRLGDLLVAKGLVDEEAVEQALASQKRPLGDILVEMGKVSKEALGNVLDTQRTLRQPPAKPEPGGSAPAKQTAIKRQDIRVDLEKLDSLINLIGEIVIAENMVLNNPDLRNLELENFGKAGTHLSKLVRELQELAMTIRMVPVSGLFRRMMRLVHDLSSKVGKKVELKLEGEETELDKTVIETITDPLVHLVRNAVDHGLENPEGRRDAGKPDKGTVVLSAAHREGEVWISLQDDGKGLNHEKILAKAISRGLVDGDGSGLSVNAINNLIFQPGFSTADKITEVSGRGVGLDVVKQNIEKINGKIEIHSEQGRGTRFDLRIPLTLGIIDGMLVRVGASRCILPTLAIRESFRPEPGQIRATPEGHQLVRVREHFFTVIRLHQVLSHAPDSSQLCDGILIVIENHGARYCLLVDEILGQQQTVIKGLPDYLGHVGNFSGCTILGDGEVCLILDMAKIITAFEANQWPCWHEPKALEAAAVAC